MFLGIDLGTGSVKALVLGEQGEVLAEHSETYEVKSRHSGWAETDTRLWWQATCKAVKSCSANFDIRAIGLSGQMHGVVLCKRDGTPLYPAILWADMRSSATLPPYHSLSPVEKRMLANPLTAGMMGPSLLWLKQHEPDLYQKADLALSPKDWLRLTLTGQAHAEPSDASATLLYDLEENSWADKLIAKLELRRELFPSLIKSSAIAGSLQTKAANDLGLKEALPVVAGGADAACSAFGSYLRQEGQVQINLGTAMQIFAIRNQAIIDQELRTHLYRTVEDNYYAMAAMQNAGIAFEWVRKVLGLSWPQMYEEAFVKTDSSKGLLFLPYLTGERTPHLNPHASACWQSMRLEHERCHLVRAAFEGIAFALKDGLLALQATGIRFESLRLAGGGSIDPRWQQLLADVLAYPLVPVNHPSASASGAAQLAARALGFDFKQEKPGVVAIEPKIPELYFSGFEAFRKTYHLLYPEKPS